MVQYKDVVLMPKSPVNAFYSLPANWFYDQVDSTSIGLDSLLLIVHALEVTTILYILKPNSFL